MDTTVESLKQKRNFLFSLGIAFQLIGVLIGLPVIFFLLFKYQVRFVSSIPTLSFMFVPILLGMWCISFGTEVSKKKRAFLLSFISTLLITSALILASIYSV
ncbi:MAG: hypothetical protein AABZ60_19605 [Planctomycetota bacterium]